MNRVGTAFVCILISSGLGIVRADSTLAASVGRNGRLASAPGLSGTAGRLTSPGGAYWLTIQTDGNLVLYRGDCAGSPNAGCSVWSSRTFGPVGEYYLAVQDDGNLVVYRGRASAGVDSAANAVWSSRSNRGRGNYFLSVQDDGNVVMWEGTGLGDRRGVVWSLRPVQGVPAVTNPGAGGGRETVAKEPAALQSLTGPWVHSAAPGAQTPDNRVILIQDGNRVTLTQSYKPGGKWVTLVCQGSISGRDLRMQCNWAPGGNPFGFANAVLDLKISPDGNHLDGVIASPSGGSRQESHYSRVP